MPVTSAEVARTLLGAHAVLLRPDSPFTFASGLRSPVYCDNRLLLGDVAARRVVAQAFAERVTGAEVLAGPATGGIPWAAWASEICGLPMAYVRSEPKAHGRGQQIEGAPLEGRRVLLLEDTVSTGGSVLNAADAVRAAGAELLGVICIFTWGWAETDSAFAQRDLPLTPLATLADLLAVAAEDGALADSQRAAVEAWAADPKGWGK
ncbi:orotate phosphoribosyltransferase [Chloroflexia bacterium SDU3-3]|nr:orotate phosphoribosyltransferase [Chloroflexia bacterium SDU3-3]